MYETIATCYYTKTQYTILDLLICYGYLFSE